VARVGGSPSSETLAGGLARPNQALRGMLRGFSWRPARTPGIWSLASTARIPGRGSFFGNTSPRSTRAISKRLRACLRSFCCSATANVTTTARHIFSSSILQENAPWRQSADRSQFFSPTWWACLGAPSPALLWRSPRLRNLLPPCKLWSINHDWGE
jgi:hypothetical protein